MMNNKRLRVGLIGLGKVGILHLEAYRLLSSVEVVAGSDVREDRVKQLAITNGFTPYIEYEEMLAREQLDIACVLTPARTHRAVVEAVAARKVHVLCEKPIATTIEDAQKMIAACESSAVKFFYAASYRCLPAMIKARELIQAEEIGEVQFLTESIVGGRGPEEYRDLGAQHYEVGGPGGCGFGLVDHGIHLADSFTWLMNSKVVSVFGRGALSGGNAVTEYLIMNFANGALGQLVYNSSSFSSDLPSEGIFSWSREWTDWTEPSPNGVGTKNGHWVEHSPSIRIHGTRGALRIFYYAGKLFMMKKDSREEIHVVNLAVPEHFASQMQSFADCILQNRQPTVTGRDGINALHIVLGAYQSCERQSVIPISTEDEDLSVLDSGKLNELRTSAQS
jgi:predicted dehydrogenase